MDSTEVTDLNLKHAVDRDQAKLRLAEQQLVFPAAEFCFRVISVLSCSLASSTQITCFTISVTEHD